MRDRPRQCEIQLLQLSQQAKRSAFLTFLTLVPIPRDAKQSAIAAWNSRPFHRAMPGVVLQGVQVPSGNGSPQPVAIEAV